MQKRRIALFASVAAFLLATATPAQSQWAVPDFSTPQGIGLTTDGFDSFGPCLSGVPFVGAGVSAKGACGTETLTSLFGVSTGLVAKTAAGAYAGRTLTAPAAGITVTNGNGVAGNPTLVLANDLGALEALSTTGWAKRTATDTWTLNTASTVLDDVGTTRGSVLYRGAAGWAILAPGTVNFVLTSGGAGADPSYAAGGSGTVTNIAQGNGITLSTAPCTTTCTVSAPLPGYLNGLNLTYASTTAIVVATGYTTDSTNVSLMNLASATTKGSGAWAVGSGNGCLDTGTISGLATYHIFVIQRSDTGVVDVLCSGSLGSPSMPANYNRKRRIASLKTNVSAQWVQFVQNGDIFTWNVPFLDVQATNPGTSAVTRTLTVPASIKLRAMLSAGFSNGGIGADNPGAIFLSDLDIADTAPSQAAGTANIMNYGTVNSTSQASMQTTEVVVNTSAQIRSRLQISGSNTVLYIATLGWIDTRDQ